MKKQKTFLALALLVTSLSFGQDNTFPPAGNVGIGTTTPISKLDVRGAISTPEIAFRNTDGGDDSDPYRLRKVQGSSNNNWLELQLNDDGNESFRIYGNSCAGFGCGEISGNLYHSFDTQGNVFHSGNLGIGTMNPQAKLDLFSATAVNGPILSIRSDFTALGKYAMIRFGDQTQTSLYQKGAIIYEGVAGSARGRFHIALNNDDTSNSVTLNDAKLTVQSDGNVGIGTTIPRAKLDVASDISNGQLGTVFGRLPEGDTDGTGTFLGVKGYSTQGVSGDVKSFSIVHDFYGRTNNSINFYRGGDMLGGFMTFCTSNNIEKMRITGNGYIGIGTTNPDEMLTVKGKIHAQEVRVDLQGACAPDYVFQKYYTGKSTLKSDYVMPTLAEIESFTKKNHHLPNVPSAQEVQQNGVSLGTMSNVLLQKVEELTLYVIEQNKYAIEQNKKLMLQQEELERLKAENENYKSLAERLSSIEKVLKK